MNKIVSYDDASIRLRNGEIGIFPTDTAYGIGCRMDREDLVEEVYKIRHRPKEKAVLILVDSIAMAQKYVIFDHRNIELANKYWPGGVTLILPCIKDNVPEIVRSGGNSLAVRMPDHKKLLEMIKKIGVPIIAPSANLSGEKTPLSFHDLDQKLFDVVDFVLEGVCTIKGVSTIIDASDKEPKIIRRGVVETDIV